MATPIFLNNVATTLASSVASGATTSFTVASGSVFGTIGAGQYIPAVVVDPSTSPETVKEYVYITAISGTTLTVTRAAESATTYPAAALASGLTVAAVATNGSLGAPVPAGTANGQVATWNSTALAYQAAAPTTGRLAITRITTASTALSSTTFTKITAFTVTTVVTPNPSKVCIKIPFINLVSNGAGLMTASFGITDNTNTYYLPGVTMVATASGQSVTLPYLAEWDLDSVATATTYTLEAWYAGPVGSGALLAGTGANGNIIPAVVSHVAGG